MSTYTNYELKAKLLPARPAPRWFKRRAKRLSGAPRSTPPRNIRRMLRQGRRSR